MAHTNPNQQHQEGEAPFSLTPAIFAPFPGLSGPPSQSLDQTQKLQRILDNLSAQHETVRQNMVYLITQRAERLISHAQAELSFLSEDPALEVEIPGENTRVRDAVEEMIRKLRVKANGKMSENFEIKVGDVGVTNGGDVDMSGMNETPQNFPRTASVIRKEIAQSLRQLINQAVAEIEAYDEHAQQTTSYYKQALERRLSRDGGVAAGGVPSTGAPGLGGNRGGDGFGIAAGRGGVLSNRHVQSPVNEGALKRMSTGMPIVGAPTKGHPPARAFENME